MKNKKKILSSIISLIILTPIFVYASWWNPLSWSWVRVLFTPKPAVVENVIPSINPVETDLPPKSKAVPSVVIPKVSPPPRSAISTTDQLPIRASKCEALISKKDKEYCYADIAGDRQDMTICATLTDPEIKDYCYGGISSYQSCSLTTSILSKSICFSGIVDSKFRSNTLTLSDCQKVDERVSKDYCYNGLAVQNKQMDICSNISVDNNEAKVGRTKCLLNVASASNKCEDSRINNPIYRDMCYSMAAFQNNNSSICQKVQNQELRNSCYQTVPAR